MKRTKRWLTAAMLPITALAGCADAPVSEIESVERPLFYDPDRVWADTTIDVCWEDLSDSHATSRDWVQTIVESEIEGVSNVDFVGWQACNGAAKEVVIRVGEDEWPRSIFGARSASASPNVWFNFFVSEPRDLDNKDKDNDVSTGADLGACYGETTWSMGPTGREWLSDRQRCVQGFAVHEFAHLLAIAHEQSRADTPATCFAPGDAYGTTDYGYWDITSVSNYCNPIANNDGRLSVLDVAWIQDFYGTNANDHLFWGIGDVRDYGGATLPQLAFAVEEEAIAGTDYIPLAGDFDNDGNDDIFWYRPGTGPDSIWFYSDDGSHVVQNETVNGTFQPMVGDFNGDQRDDIFWYRPGSENDPIWFFNANRTHSSQTESVSGTFTPVAGDFNNDGVSDVFWYRAGSLHDPIWFFNTNKTHTEQNETVDGTFDAFAGDFNGDGVSDVFFYGPGSANDNIWYFTTSKTHQVATVTVNGTYEPAAGDFDGDGVDDVLWFRPGADGDHIWSMKTTRGWYDSSEIRFDSTGIPVVGDFNDDDLDDVFFYSQ